MCINTLNYPEFDMSRPEMTGSPDINYECEAFHPTKAVWKRGMVIFKGSESCVFMVVKDGHYGETFWATRFRKLESQILVDEMVKDIKDCYQRGGVIPSDSLSDDDIGCYADHLVNVRGWVKNR